MQVSRLPQPPIDSRQKCVAVVRGSRNREPAARGIPPSFDGTIASACELGISLESFVDVMRSVDRSDSVVARFLDAWDALDAFEQGATGVADAICRRLGLAPVDLLNAVANVAYRFSMYTAQIMASLALPSVVERSIDTALTEEGVADRKMLFQHSGFLPTPKGSQTTITIAQNAQAIASARAPIVPAPSPEDTIRRCSDRFNEARGLPRAPAAAPSRSERQ